MTENNRKFARVNYPCSITVWSHDGSSEVIMANTANISAGGLCVYFNKPLALDTQLEIKIDNFFEGSPLKCMGKVVRSKADTKVTDSRQKFFEIGVEFSQIDEDQRKYLAGFVERLMALEAKHKS